MKRILIVEDVEWNRDLLVQILEEDYEVLEAVDGREGIEKAKAEKPDLILTDMLMPEIGGLELAEPFGEARTSPTPPSSPSPRKPWPGMPKKPSPPAATITSVSRSTKTS